MKIYNSLSTVLWVSLVSISMILQVPKDVSAAWGWNGSSSSSETKEVDEVQINEEALTAEIPVSFENHSSMELYIHWVNRDTHEETSVLDTPLLPSGELNIQSYPGHTFVAFNEERTVRLVYLVDIDEKNARKFIITEKDLSPDREVTATFINTSSQSVHINSVNQETKEEQSVAHNVASFVGEIDDDTDVIKPQQGVVSIQSYPGHVFAIFDEERSFRTLLTIDPSHTHGDQAVFTITDFDTDPLACEAHFINSLTTPESVVRVTWVNPDTGKETTVIDQLLANQARSIQTRKGHTFFAYDVQHTFFRTEFVIHAGQGQEQFLHITGVNGSATANKTLAKFINMSPTSMVHINYLNKETQEEQLVIENLRPREDHVLETHSGHQFVAYDEAQTFRKVYTMTVDKGMTERHLIDGTARTCSDVPPTSPPTNVSCFDDSCTLSGNEQACIEGGSCYWYPPLFTGGEIGLCSSCAGVQCVGGVCRGPDSSSSPSTPPTMSPSESPTMNPTTSPTSSPSSSPSYQEYIQYAGYDGVHLNDLGKCGRFDSQKAIEDYCNSDDACKGYSWDPTKNSQGGPWWCAKTTSDRGVSNTNAVWYQKP